MHKDYTTEEFVGEALKELGGKPDGLYITTKFAGLKEPVRPSMETSLKKVSVVSHVDGGVSYGAQFIQNR